MRAKLTKIDYMWLMQSSSSIVSSYVMAFLWEMDHRLHDYSLIIDVSKR